MPFAGGASTLKAGGTLLERDIASALAHPTYDVRAATLKALLACYSEGAPHTIYAPFLNHGAVIRL